MAGDLKNGRTVHSLARLLTRYRNIKLQYVSPDSLRMPEAVKQYVEQHGITEQVGRQEIHLLLMLFDFSFASL